MEVKCKTQDYLNLSELTEFQGGLKERDEHDFEKIEKSIKKYGFAFPFFVWKHDGINHVLDGHGRYGALSRMVARGETLPQLPVVYVDCKDEEAAKNLLLRLNSHYGNMTAETVLEFMDGLEIDIDELNLPSGTIDLHIEPKEEETTGDDDCPELNEDEEPNSKPGEMYELGGSILMCGDSTKEEDVARLMGNVQADMVVTDPPYNVDVVGGSHTMPKELRKLAGHKTIQNDKMDKASFYDFLVKVFTNIKVHTKAGGSFYIWYADLESENFMLACTEAGLTRHQVLIWNKNSLVIGRMDYQQKHEPCIYGWIDGAAHSWQNDRKQTTVIDCKRPTANKEHPTMKPVELIEYQIRNSSKAGDIILDLFGGSGTTLIAAERSGRKARLMELDPHYCDVIRRRYTKWAKENGKPVGSGALEE